MLIPTFYLVGDEVFMFIAAYDRLTGMKLSGILLPLHLLFLWPVVCPLGLMWVLGSELRS